jgi:hypothetical protein
MKGQTEIIGKLLEYERIGFLDLTPLTPLPW